MIKNFTERKKKPHNYQIELKKNYDGTIEYVRAVKGIFLKKELGILGFIEGIQYVSVCKSNRTS